jgi:hypothetical protein
LSKYSGRAIAEVFVDIRADCKYLPAGSRFETHRVPVADAQRIHRALTDFGFYLPTASNGKEEIMKKIIVALAISALALSGTASAASAASTPTKKPAVCKVHQPKKPLGKKALAKKAAQPAKANKKSAKAGC